MTNQSTTIVIFGASGDLTRRKLIPALFNLCRKNRMPANYNIVGFSRSDLGTDGFRQRMREGADEFVEEPFSQAEWDTFAAHLHYVVGGLDKTTAYANLKNKLSQIEDGESNRLYYLATPPRFFAAIVAQLGAAGMVQETISTGSTITSTSSVNVEPVETHTESVEVWRRVVIEKPFGRDLASAQALNHAIHTDLAEHQIYRIDHYLAKETVQNMLYFRFGNTMFEPLWNRNYIDHVQITVAESVDVGHRAGYYDQAGVLRDMFQNHLMQLLALVSMEPPSSFSADAVRDEKVKALSSIRPMNAAQTVRAQYDGYLDAPGVAMGSQTPTYAAVQLHIDNWRWQGVPFYLRSGKAMAQKATEILIQFKRPPHMMFSMSPDEELRANYLAICIQPHEGIHQRFEAKVPDTPAEMRSVHMNFHYDEAFGEEPIPEAYERLLLNALEGDATLFTRSDGIEAAWRTIDPILQAWETGDAPMATYAPHSWGPDAADVLLEKNGRKWRYSCAEHQ